MEFNTTLDIAVKIVELFGLPLAFAALWLSSRQTAKAQDLQTVLSLSDSFRSRWEGGWQKTIIKCEKLAASDKLTSLPKGLELELRTILNWIDWLGVMMKWRLLNQPQAVLQSIGPSIENAISLGRFIVERDEDNFGVGHWSGLREVEVYMKNRQLSGRTF